MHRAISKNIVILILTCCAFIKVNAQQVLPSTSPQKLAQLQDSLQKLSEATFTAPDDISRVSKNTQFVKNLIEALKLDSRLSFNFDSLKRISILKSPDHSFRIITWFMPTDDGTFRYYGAIQMATSNGSLKLHPLTDYSAHLKDQYSLTSASNWLGARYYEMVPVILNGKPPYYILLGWKGNDNKTSKKVIEVLNFEKDEVVFGKNIFETAKNKPLQNRVIFEFNKMNNMTLLFDKKSNTIVFDHLVPFEPNMIGNYEYYASDSSFDGYKLAYGKLSLLENINIKNEATANDAEFKNPIKASNIIPKNR